MDEATVHRQRAATPGHPGAEKAKYAEYLDPTNPNWVGSINPAITQAAFVANRTVFTNNRFTRRYYLRDGLDSARTADLGPVSGVSAYYPDLSNAVAATGQFIDRRFYTPSWASAPPAPISKTISSR